MASRAFVTTHIVAIDSLPPDVPRDSDTSVHTWLETVLSLKHSVDFRTCRNMSAVRGEQILVVMSNHVVSNKAKDTLHPHCVAAIFTPAHLLDHTPQGGDPKTLLDTLQVLSEGILKRVSKMNLTAFSRVLKATIATNERLDAEVPQRPAPRPPPPLPAKKPCEFHAKGLCVYGANCRNSHEVVVVNVLEAAPPPPPVEVVPICRFYQLGECTFGHMCRYLHSGLVVSSPPYIVPTAPPLAENVCNHFLIGNCKFGSRCAFVHPGVQMEEEAPEVDDANVCLDWMGGRCRFGRQCLLVHPMT